MAYSIVLHIQGEEPVVAEMEELPGPGDLTITVNNPRRMDGKELHYLADNVITVVYPMFRMNFIEVLPTKEEERIIGFVRE